jgi:3-hydroxyisobutyrate dehydrogenase-like beta-hydroxyacid dehydrogenase
MIVRDFTPGGRVRLHHKDLGIALELAVLMGCRFRLQNW